VKSLSVDILLLLAVLCEVVCVAGVIFSATVYDRLHYAGATTAVAPFLVMAAMIVEEGYYQATWNAIFVAVALFVLNAVLTHATARVARGRARGDLEL
jgi:multisubunit Na+/H+ antiporter MnhG subunit